MRPQEPIDPTTVKKAKAQAEIVKYRVAGMTVPEISAQVELPVSTVSEWLREAIQDLRHITIQDAEILRTIAHERYEDLYLRMFKVLSSTESGARNVPLVTAMLKLLQQHASLMGYSADSFGSGGGSGPIYVLKPLGSDGGRGDEE